MQMHHSEGEPTSVLQKAFLQAEDEQSDVHILLKSTTARGLFTKKQGGHAWQVALKCKKLKMIRTTL